MSENVIPLLVSLKKIGERRRCGELNAQSMRYLMALHEEPVFRAEVQAALSPHRDVWSEMQMEMEAAKRSSSSKEATSFSNVFVDLNPTGRKSLLIAEETVKRRRI